MKFPRSKIKKEAKIQGALPVCLDISRVERILLSMLLASNPKDFDQSSY